MSKDWALTAWGENGPLSVGINGKTSDVWPEIGRQDSLLPQDELEISSTDTSDPPVGQTDQEKAESYATAAETAADLAENKLSSAQ